MFDASELCREAGIERSVLEVWIQAGWIHVQPKDSGGHFSATDLARARLICDLVGPMGVNEDGIAVILDLLDQIHGLRRALQTLSSAVAVQQLSVRQRILADALGLVPPEGSGADDGS